MKSQILSLVLTICIVVIGVTLPVTAEVIYSGDLGDNLIWEIDDTDTLTIKGTGAMPDFDDRHNLSPYHEYYDYINYVVIEEGVTSIGEYAFYDCYEINSISIPITVTSIAGSAFEYIEDLTSFTVAEGNTSFCTDDGNLYSSDKTQLIRYCQAKPETEWTIPSSVTTLNPYSLRYTNIVILTIPDSVETIGEMALSGGVWEEMNIPSSVEAIGDYALLGCDRLSQITVDADNPNYCSDDGVLFTKDKTTLCQYPIGSARISYYIPDSVKNISAHAFSGSTLHTLAIPNTLDSIGDYAFNGSYNLSTVLNGSTKNAIRRVLGQTNECIYEENLINEWDKVPAKIGAFNCYYNDGTLYACPDFEYILNNGTLFIAIYNSDGTLKAIQSAQASVDSLSPTIEIASTEDLTGCSAKAFFMKDHAALSPLSNMLDTSVKHGEVVKDTVLEKDRWYDSEIQTYICPESCTGINVTFTPTSYIRDIEGYFIINDEPYSTPKTAGRTISVTGGTLKVEADDGVFETRRIAIIF